MENIYVKIYLFIFQFCVFHWKIKSYGLKQHEWINSRILGGVLNPLYFEHAICRGFITNVGLRE